jgi:hypothetical protein
MMIIMPWNGEVLIAMDSAPRLGIRRSPYSARKGTILPLQSIEIAAGRRAVANDGKLEHGLDSPSLKASDGASSLRAGKKAMGPW